MKFSINVSKTSKKQQTGFTLVELMIVVAIIGILASIAIPNYQKYQAKARTSEGKIQLAAVYTAQKSYFIEYSSYTGCLASAGYAPDLGSSNNTSRYYAVGFKAGASAGSNCGPTGNEVCETGSTWGNGAATCTASVDGASSSGGTFWSATATAAGGAGSPAKGTNLPTTTVSATSFTIGAAAGLNPNSATVFDQWSINDAKIVSQTFTGF